jgi:hypothetical protein
MSEETNSSIDPPSSVSTKVKRIAVVAVHGVGDHAPFATAREIGDLLSNLEYKPDNSPRYAPFTEVVKRLNVRPVKIGDARAGFNWTDHALEDNTWGPMDALARAVYQGKADVKAAHDADNEPESLDHLFMKGQLMKYKGEKPEDTYDCLRLEGRRIVPAPPKGGGPPHPPAADRAGEMASELRESGVQLPSPPAQDPTSAGSPQLPAEPGSPGGEGKIVHVYEMYWSDLSQIGGAATRILGELYQLLFHLGSVSVNNVLAAAIHFNSTKYVGTKWRRFAQAQWFAAATLAWPVPLLNLFIAAVVPVILVLSAMRSHLSARGEFLALDALATLVCIVGSGLLLRLFAKVGMALYVLPLPLLVALGIWFGGPKTPWDRDTTEEIAGAVLFALALGVVWLIVKAYDERRPGSKVAALLVAAALAVGLELIRRSGGLPFGGSNGYPAIETCLNYLELACLLLGASWAAFYAGYFWAHVAGWFAVRAVPTEADNPDCFKARSTRWTAQLVLALSSLIFVTLTISLWAGILKVAVKALPGEQNVPSKDICAYVYRHDLPPVPDTSDDVCQGNTCSPARYRSITAALYHSLWKKGYIRLYLDDTKEIESHAKRYAACPLLVSGWADRMLNSAGIGFLPLYLIALLAALAITLWAFFPSIWAEINPPGPEAPGKLRWQSSSMGSWLDCGFKFIRGAGEVLYWTMWLPPLLFAVFNFKFVVGMFSNAGESDTLIAVVGSIVAGTAVGILGFSGRLKHLAGGLRPMLRVMLDIDNWLREHPRSSNPTARICGRYVSLLRHISAWRDSDPDGSQYDAMVIIAHSQGTVITADFLRFLHAEKTQAHSMQNYDPELEHFGDMRTYLFSMGCPLYQLYGVRFPYLYGWARNEIPRGPVSPGLVPDIGTDEAPRPNHLGVERWVNAYRTGDYIGRYLWRGGEVAYRWDPITTGHDQEWDPPAGKPDRISADKAGQRIEFSIGPGAHTHYWDHTAGLIAEVLDRIIDSA